MVAVKRAGNECVEGWGIRNCRFSVLLFRKLTTAYKTGKAIVIYCASQMKKAIPGIQIEVVITFIPRKRFQVLTLVKEAMLNISEAHGSWWAQNC